MYGAATFRMRDAIGLSELGWLPKLTLAVALVAWAATFVGLLHLIASSLRDSVRRRQPGESPAAATGT
jgi:CHASE2 domain-containing sensor protein